LGERNADDVRIAAEACHGENVATGPARINAGTYRVDAPGNLVARHDRHRRQVGINTKPAHDVGEIDAACFDTNPYLPGSRLRVGGFLDLQNFGWSGFGDPNLTHANCLRLILFGVRNHNRISGDHTPLRPRPCFCGRRVQT
jgi:hypothetical protein